MEAPQISIIVPVYNVEDYLRQCLDSIIAQTFTDWECIFVDDGSKDGSGRICDEYAQKDDRFKVIHKENGGVAKARIDGFNASQGEYVFFIDADDTIEADAIEKLFKNSQKYNVDISICQISVVVDGNKTQQYRAAGHGYYTKDDLQRFLKENFLFDVNSHRSGFPLYLWGKLFKREVLVDKLERGNGFWYGEDMVAILSIVEETGSLYISDKSLYNYYQYPMQVTRKSFDSLYPQYVKVWNCLEETDTDGIFDTQLPQRMWWVVMSGLKTFINRESDFRAFRKLFSMVRDTPIVQRKIFDAHFYKALPLTHKVLHYLFKKKWSRLYYITVKYDLFQKINKLAFYKK